MYSKALNPIFHLMHCIEMNSIESMELNEKKIVFSINQTCGFSSRFHLMQHIHIRMRYATQIASKEKTNKKKSHENHISIVIGNNIM